MSQTARIDELLAEVRKQLAPLRAQVVYRGDHFVVDVHGSDGTVLWPDFARGSTDVLALLTAAQRYLVEEVGSGAVAGPTYTDKAQERLHRWQES